MPAKRCIETKNMCLLFVDYCKKRRQYPKRNEKLGIGKKKRRQYPKGKEKLGIGKKK